MGRVNVSGAKKSTGNAIPAYLLSGYTATTASGDITGTMPNRTFAANGNAYISPASFKADGGGYLCVAPQEGYYKSEVNAGGFGEIGLVDTDFVASNFLATKNIFGLQGSIPVVPASYGDQVHTSSISLGAYSGDGVNRLYLQLPYANSYYGGINWLDIPAQNHVASNIKNGVYDLGVTGTYLAYGSGDALPISKLNVFAPATVTMDYRLNADSTSGGPVYIDNDGVYYVTGWTIKRADAFGNIVWSCDVSSVKNSNNNYPRWLYADDKYVYGAWDGNGTGSSTACAINKSTGVRAWASAVGTGTYGYGMTSYADKLLVPVYSGANCVIIKNRDTGANIAWTNDLGSTIENVSITNDGHMYQQVMSGYTTHSYLYDGSNFIYQGMSTDYSKLSTYTGYDNGYLMSYGSSTTGALYLYRFNPTTLGLIDTTAVAGSSVTAYGSSTLDRNIQRPLMHFNGGILTRIFGDKSVSSNPLSYGNASVTVIGYKNGAFTYFTNYGIKMTKFGSTITLV